MIISRAENNFFLNWFRSLDKTLLFIILTWLLLGIFFSFVSTLKYPSEKLYNDPNFLFEKYLKFVFFGFFVLIVTSFYSDGLLKKILPYALILSVLLLILVLFKGLEVKGSKRWLDLFFFRFQPVELLKPIMVLFLAYYFEDEKNMKLKFFLSSFLVFFIISLLLMQPDYSQSLFVLFLWGVTIFISGISLLFIIFITVSVLTFMGTVLFLFQDKFQYIFLRIDKWLGTTEISYQSEKALDAIIYGGFFGRGIGEGILKEKIPEAHTDYVLAAISEEFGIITLFIIIFLVSFFCIKTFAIAQNANSNFKKITLSGLSSLLLLQVLINFGVTINLLPTTGMTFPFLSYGGSSIVTSSFILGIILGATRRNL